MNLFYELISDYAGEQIKKERKEWEMSRRLLAKLVKVDKETIEKIEEGYICMLDIDLLRMISEVLNVNMFSFFKRELTNEEMLEIV